VGNSLLVPQGQERAECLEYHPVVIVP
jgi:hypothetical protein